MTYGKENGHNVISLHYRVSSVELFNGILGHDLVKEIVVELSLDKKERKHHRDNQHSKNRCNPDEYKLFLVSTRYGDSKVPFTIWSLNCDQDAVTVV